MLRSSHIPKYFEQNQDLLISWTYDVRRAQENAHDFGTKEIER
jgi:hypothetical protein